MRKPIPVPVGLRACGSGLSNAVPPFSILLWISFYNLYRDVIITSLMGSGTHFLWTSYSGLHCNCCVPCVPRPDSKLWGNPSPVPVGLLGVALASQPLCPPPPPPPPTSMMLLISFQRGVRGWGHYKFEGVGAPIYCWTVTRACNYFCINNYYKLIGDRVPVGL